MHYLKHWLRTLPALLGFVLAAATANAAYLTNVPITLEQPNGAEVSLLSSGDEFYNWVHDSNGFVIVRHPESGWLVYATRQRGRITATEHVVGSVEPAAVGLVPDIRPDDAIVEAKRAARAAPAMAADGPQPAPKAGTITSIVIFIRFSDDTEYTTQRLTYNTLFNNPTGNSLYSYYREASYNRLSIQSQMYPIATGATVVSYQDTMPRNYFEPYNATSNPNGYLESQVATREHALLSRAVNYVRSQIPTDLNLDMDADGLVDSIAFIAKGGTGAWADLLWPHAWALYTQSVYINNKRIGNYSFQLNNSTLSSGVGVLAHETGHTLGMPDLYRYNDGEPNDPVGGWDVMAWNQNPPQHMGAYMKWRYMGWIGSIPEITTSGVYTLNPLTSPTGNCFKIKSPNSTSEYFVVEYRRKVGTYEYKVPGSGLVVYRINGAKSGAGNSQGPPDEIYVYRPNGTMTSDGNVSSANYSSTYGRTAINDTTSPSAFLSTGAPGGLNISNVGAVGDTISFTVTIGPPGPAKMMIATFYGQAREGETFPFTVRVGVMDNNNRIIKDSTLPITIGLKPDSGAPGAVLTGTTTLNAVEGLASFTDLSIDKASTGYVLTGDVRHARACLLRGIHGLAVHVQRR